MVDADGNAVGSVVAIHNFGAGDLIEVKPAQGGATVMLPFTDAAVPVVDIAGAADRGRRRDVRRRVAAAGR